MAFMRDQIDIGEDIAQQRKVWVIERVAWSLMAIVILGALLGFTGHGHFSERVAQAPGSGLSVSYQRFARHAAQTLLSLRVNELADGAVRLRVGQQFLGAIEVMNIEPQPESVELDAAHLTYVFKANGPGQILLHYKPVAAGSLQIEIGLDGEPLQRLPQFVYP